MPCAGVDPAQRRRLVVLELGVVGQVLAVDRDDRSDAGERHDEADRQPAEKKTKKPQNQSAARFGLPCTASRHPIGARPQTSKTHAADAGAHAAARPPSAPPAESHRRAHRTARQGSLPAARVPEKPFVISVGACIWCRVGSGCSCHSLLLVFVARSRHRRTAEVVLDDPGTPATGASRHEEIHPGRRPGQTWARAGCRPRRRQTAVKRAGPEPTSTSDPAAGQAPVAGRRRAPPHPLWNAARGRPHLRRAAVRVPERHHDKENADRCHARGRNPRGGGGRKPGRGIRLRVA